MKTPEEVARETLGEGVGWHRMTHPALLDLMVAAIEADREQRMLDDDREALDPLRDAIKHALRNVKWTETGDLLGYIPEGVLGMYADAVLAMLRRHGVEGIAGPQTTATSTPADLAGRDQRHGACCDVPGGPERCGDCPQDRTEKP